MRWKDFAKDKALFLCCLAIQLFLIIMLGAAFQVHVSYVVAVVFLEVFTVLVFLLLEYRKKKRFYCKMVENLEELDKKYLITEMIGSPDFLEGKIFCDALYEIDKSMNERVGELERSVVEFREYVEMWIHEIKLPISAISLMNYNEKANSAAYRQQMDKISNYVEQILFYARADAPQKDFLMKRCRLEQMINAALLENKQALIAGHFTIEKENTEVCVTTDAKWVQFMLGQILNNSIKYKQGETGFLRFEVKDDKDSVYLSVEDHGIGVSEQDVERVFDKSFTGKNGRKVAASTGMGLYICRKMCRKLGHEISLESEEGRFTRVTMRFGKDGYILTKS